jgi:hypothetical protein
MRTTGVIGDHVVCEIGKRGIVAESIARFKGLESDAVVLVLSESAVLDEIPAKSELYVGLSRARGFLYIIGPRSVGKHLGIIG